MSIISSIFSDFIDELCKKKRKVFQSDKQFVAIMGIQFKFSDKIEMAKNRLQHHIQHPLIRTFNLFIKSNNF